MITAVIIARNEENNILDCLDTLEFCDEVIVVDDNSEDRTIALAQKKKTVRIAKRKLEEDFSAQRNYALDLAKNEWVLFVDADERVSSALAQEIREKVQSDTTDGYFIKRQDKLFGKTLTHGELANKKFLRLGRKVCGKWYGKVHEEWQIKGKVSTLKNPLIHLPHQTIKEFISEIDFYTTLRAEELHKQGVRSNWFTIIAYPKGKFIDTYFLKMGFRDGMPGLVVSLIMSLHSFLVRGKLYLLQKKIA